MHGSISIKTYRFQEIVITKQQNAKSVTDASIWVKFISKSSITLDIEDSLLYSPIIIRRFGFYFTLTDLVNKRQMSRESGPVNPRHCITRRPMLGPVLRPIKRENHNVKTLVASLVGLGLCIRVCECVR